MALVRATQQTALPTVRGPVGELKKLTREAASAPALDNLVANLALDAAWPEVARRRADPGQPSGRGGRASWPPGSTPASTLEAADRAGRPARRRHPRPAARPAGPGPSPGQPPAYSRAARRLLDGILTRPLAAMTEDEREYSSEPSRIVRDRAAGLHEEGAVAGARSGRVRRSGRDIDRSAAGHRPIRSRPCRAWPTQPLPPRERDAAAAGGPCRRPTNSGSRTSRPRPRRAPGPRSRTSSCPHDAAGAPGGPPWDQLHDLSARTAWWSASSPVERVRHGDGPGPGRMRVNKSVSQQKLAKFGGPKGNCGASVADHRPARGPQEPHAAPGGRVRARRRRPAAGPPGPAGRPLVRETEQALGSLQELQLEKKSKTMGARARLVRGEGQQAHPRARGPPLRGRPGRAQRPVPADRPGVRAHAPRRGRRSSCSSAT